MMANSITECEYIVPNIGDKKEYYMDEGVRKRSFYI